MATVQLSNGSAIPAIAFGTGTAWYNRTGSEELNRELIESVKTALRLGVRHIDAAEAYGTEREVGVALKEFLAESGLKREDVFVTTKVLKSLRDVKQALNSSLQKLQLSYVDLYLIHHPFLHKLPDNGSGVSLQQAWRELEGLVDAGLTKAIGVSNFRVSDLQGILSNARIKPVVNQIEFHPYLQQPKLQEFLHQHNIVTEAYAPLVPLVHKPGGPVDAVVQRLADKYNRTTGEVLLRWSLQKGNVVVTTSSKPERLKAALSISDFQLAPEEERAIDEAGASQVFRKFYTDETHPEE